jgi:hypothetical protein
MFCTKVSKHSAKDMDNRFLVSVLFYLVQQNILSEDIGVSLKDLFPWIKQQQTNLHNYKPDVDRWNCSCFLRLWPTFRGNRSRPVPGPLSSKMISNGNVFTTAGTTNQTPPEYRRERLDPAEPWRRRSFKQVFIPVPMKAAIPIAD